MSEQDKQSGVVVGGRHGIEHVAGGQRLHLGAHARLWGLIAVCVVIVAGVGVGIYALVHQPPKPVTSTNNNVPKASLPAGWSTFSSQQKADYYTITKDYAAAYNIYNAQLKAAQTPADKSAAYDAMGTVALDTKDYSQAVKYEKQADTVNPTYVTAKSVAYAAQMDGDNKTAAQYYQLAITRLTAANLPNSDRALRELQDDLAEVQK